MEWTYGVLAVAPGVFLLCYFYRRDKWEREPPLLVLATFFGGVLMVLPVLAVIYFMIGVKLYMPDAEFVNVVIFAPLLEEPAKMLAVVLIAYPRRAFNEPMDGIVYATAAALGFASLENIFYVLGALKQSESDAVTTLVVRTLLSVPGHALFAIPWGLALGLAKFDPDRFAGRRHIMVGLAVGIGFHAAHNLLAEISEWIDGGFLFVLAIYLWKFGNWRIRIALARSPFAPEPQNAEDIGFWS